MRKRISLLLVLAGFAAAAVAHDGDFRADVSDGGLFLALVVGVVGLYHGRAIAQKAEAQAPADWVAEIEKIFIRSEDCKQCHDRHYEEWKGVREQTPDLKTFGRVDAALEDLARRTPLGRIALRDGVPL